MFISKAELAKIVSDMMSDHHCRIQKLETKLEHLENEEEALALIAEYDRLTTLNFNTFISTYMYQDARIHNVAGSYSWPNGMSLIDFEHIVLAPLRKERLNQLEKAATEPKASVTTASGTAVYFDSGTLAGAINCPNEGCTQKVSSKPVTKKKKQ